MKPFILRTILLTLVFLIPSKMVWASTAVVAKPVVKTPAKPVVTLPPKPVIPAQIIMGSPVIGAPVMRPGSKSCSVTVIKDFQFDSFGKISGQPYQTPADCPPPWSKIILDMDGKADGSQASRHGFIWFGKAEILRFNTPAPDHYPIRWHIEKDVTQYSSLFAINQYSSPFLVQLDNTKTANLNGIYQINAKLTFYKANAIFPATLQPAMVIPLANGDATQPFKIAAKPTVREVLSAVNLPTNITKAFLEVYATPQDNEAFWYLPGGSPAPYRELQIYIDGKLAAVTWPFPYIYPDGFNPHLWTPITAIDVLNIPPYLIDLTPFAGMLNTAHGKDNIHRISIKLNVLADSWLIDSNLLLFTDSANPVVKGQVTEYHITPQAVVADIGNNSRVITRNLTVSGNIKTVHGTIVTTITQDFSLRNRFTLHPNTNDVVDQMMNQEINTKTTVTHEKKPAQITQAQHSYTLLIAPSIQTIDDTLAKAFTINQSMQNTSQTTVNGKQTAAFVFYENVKSNSNPPVKSSKQDNYSGVGISFYRDASGKCFYQHLTSAQNVLTENMQHDVVKYKPYEVLDIYDSLSAKCK